jgi:hypothetical protein
MFVTHFITADGLTVYDLSPQSSELCAVAGPAGRVDPIDMDDLPEGFRWVTDHEWESLQPDEMDYSTVAEKVLAFSFRTDSEHGRLMARDFTEAKQMLGNHLPGDAIANGGWGWVDDQDGNRFTVGDIP